MTKYLHQVDACVARILAHTGERVVIDVEGQPWVVGNFPVETFPPDEWHDFRVLAEGGESGRLQLVLRDPVIQRKYGQHQQKYE